MNLFIEQLLEDHRQIIKVMYHLEQEARAYAGLSGRPTNHDKILDILDYIRVYPERWHHPAENIVFGQLLKKNIPQRQAVLDIVKQHSTLNALTRQLQHSFSAGARGEQVDRALIIRTCNDYRRDQLQHIHSEQTIIFPLLERYLDDSDWQQIKLQLSQHDKPHSDQPRDEYQALSRNIAASHAATAH